MEIATIGFTQSSAEHFFERLRAAGVRRLIDVRLHNVSQLAGFAKRDDLAYFLRTICDADYLHEPRLAPSEELLSSYRGKEIEWSEYERRFLDLISERRVHVELKKDLFARSVLLCSEASAEHCHRRLVAEYLQARWGNLQITHL